MEKINIVHMTPKDFAFAASLTDVMNWDLTEKDLGYMMDLEPEGCFVALDGAERAGVVTTVRFDNIGWIGAVMVDLEHRSKGVGSLLMKHAMDYLTSRSVKTIGLYSYVDTAPFYERFGFKRDSSFIRLVGQGATGSIRVKALKRMRESDLQDVVNLDGLCVGGSRERLLRRILMDSRELCYVARKNKQLVSFIMADWYRREIGPWVCHPGFDAEAVNLLRVVLSRLAGLEVHIGVPEKRREILDALRDMNFREELRVVRMYYGESLGDKGCLLAMESLERG